MLHTGLKSCSVYMRNTTALEKSLLVDARESAANAGLTSVKHRHNVQQVLKNGSHIRQMSPVLAAYTS